MNVETYPKPTPLPFFGVRLYLLEGSIPAALLEEVRSVGSKVDEIIDLLLSRRTEKELAFLLESVSRSYAQLSFQNFHIISRLATAHPGPFHLSFHEAIQADLDFLDSLSEGFLHPLLKDDLEWCLRCSKQTLHLLLTDRGLINAFQEPSFFSWLRELQQSVELPSSSLPSDLQASLDTLLLVSTGNLCLFSAVKYLRQTPEQLHPLFESFCEKAYWSFRSFSKQLPSFRFFPDLSLEERTQRILRYADQIVPSLSAQEQQTFFAALERRSV